MMNTKKVKTQNGKQKPDATYKGRILELFYLDEHIDRLNDRREGIVNVIRQTFHKSDENIVFELNKLKRK